KEQDKSNTHRTHISSETFSTCSEIEKRKHQHRQHAVGQQIRINECQLAIGEHQQATDGQTVRCRDAVDTVHKVIGIDHAHHDNKAYQQNVPRHRKQVQLICHQQHRRKVHQQTHLVG